MKKKILVFLTILICILTIGLCSCGLNKNEDKIYDVSNDYFGQAYFEKNILNSVGVNGHQGSGTSYEIRVFTKCRVSLIECIISIRLYSKNDELLDKFENNLQRSIAKSADIISAKYVTMDIYNKLDYIIVECNGKSKEDPHKVASSVLNPIKTISLENKNTMMLVGETIDLSYTIYPTNTDENLVLKSSDDSIVEVRGDKLFAKKEGETYVVLKVLSDATNMISKEIHIKVEKPLNYSDFYLTYNNRLLNGTIDVYCKRYNTNWLGQEKDTFIVSGKGTIVNSESYLKYFLTDKGIFDKISTQYEYEEWYIIDSFGDKYSINGMQTHKYAPIGIGTFNTSREYSVTSINNAYAYEKDYVFSLFGNPLTCRIDKLDYMKIYQDDNKNMVFLHEAGASTKNRGEAIYNRNGEIIGMNVSYMNGKAIAISSLKIRELYNAIFHLNSSGNGGPIDIV